MNTPNPLLPAFDQEERWTTLFGTPTNARVGAPRAIMQMTEFKGRLVVLAATAGGFVITSREIAPIMIFTGQVWRSAGASFIGSVDLLASDNKGLLLAGVFEKGINADGTEVPLGFFAHWDGENWLNLDKDLTDLLKVRKFNGTFYALATINGKPNTLAKLERSGWKPIQQFTPESTIGDLKVKTPPTDFVVSDDEAVFINGKYDAPPVKIILKDGTPSEFINDHNLVGIRGSQAFFRATQEGTLLTALKEGNGYLLGGEVSENVTFQHPGFDIVQRKIRRNNETLTINTHEVRRAQSGEHFETVNGLYHISSDGKKLDPLQGGVRVTRNRPGVIHVLARDTVDRVLVGGDFQVVGPDVEHSADLQTPTPNVPRIPGFENEAPAKPVILPLESNPFRSTDPGLATAGLAFLTGKTWGRPSAAFRRTSVGFPSTSDFPGRTFFNNPLRQFTRVANPGVSDIVIGESATYLGGAFLASGATLLNNVAALVGNELAPLMNQHNQGIDGFGSSSGLANPVAVSPNGDLYAVMRARQAGDLTEPGMITRFNGVRKAWEDIAGLPAFGRIDAITVAQEGVFKNQLFVTATLISPFKSPDGAEVTNEGLFRFDGKAWHGLALEEASANRLAVDHLGRVHALGSRIEFRTPSGRLVRLSGLVFFDGSTWRTHERLRNRFGNGIIRDFAQHGKSLFICGGFTRIGGLSPNHVAVFDGVRFHSFGKGLRLKGQTIDRARAEHIAVGPDGLVYVTGNFDEAVNENGTVIPVKGMAVWKGHTWDPWGGGLDDFEPGSSNTVIREMTTTPKGVIIAGQFNQVGGKTIRQFARWDGQEWHALEPDMLADAFERRSGGFLTGLGETLLMGAGFRTAHFHSSLNLAAYDLVPDEEVALQVDPFFEPNFAPLKIKVNASEDSAGLLEIFANAKPEKPLFTQAVSAQASLEWDGLIEVSASDELQDRKPVALVSPLHSPLLIRATFGEQTLEGLVEINAYLRFDEEVAQKERNLLLANLRQASGFTEDEVKLSGDEILIRSTRNDRFITEGSPLYRSYLKYLSEAAILRLSKSDNPAPVRQASRHGFSWNYQVLSTENAALDPFFKVLEDLGA